MIDGDTLEVRVGGATERVRLIGINTPESGECFADEATEALAGLVAGREVRLVRDTSGRDQYDRLLAYVEVDGEHVNEALVRGGYAIARAYPPDTARADALAAAQREAEQAAAGMWAADGCASDVDARGIALSVRADAPGDDGANLNGEWLDIANTGRGPARPVRLERQGRVRQPPVHVRRRHDGGARVEPAAVHRLRPGQRHRAVLVHDRLGGLEQRRRHGVPARRRGAHGHDVRLLTPSPAHAGWPMLTIQAVPNRSTHIPKWSPHGACWSGSTTVPPSDNAS